mmetsp:Transcript_14883/g.64417  ORF Transcript_14883/g.64417 Transcript_14883/m.64417 type:complete len:205 (+) Transcript_14883:319-933(+)
MSLAPASPISFDPKSRCLRSWFVDRDSATQKVPSAVTLFPDTISFLRVVFSFRALASHLMPPSPMPLLPRSSSSRPSSAFAKALAPSGPIELQAKSSSRTHGASFAASSPSDNRAARTAAFSASLRLCAPTAEIPLKPNRSALRQCGSYLASSRRPGDTKLLCPLIKGLLVFALSLAASVIALAIALAPESPIPLCRRFNSSSA